MIDMKYEDQKVACARYAQKNGGSVADVIRVSGRRGAVVLSMDGRTIYDPFVVEPIAEVITAQPAGEKEAAAPGVKAPKKKAAPRKKK